MTIKIDSNIPLPVRQHAGPRPDAGYTRYPFKQMKPGDSFFIPADARVCVLQLQANLRSATYRAPGKYTSRKWRSGGKDGVRVWRIE